MDCPAWFKYVACVVVYNSRGEVFLGKRREGEAEGGKWAILGGSGAFGESENRRDFARRELQYDIRINFNPERLIHLTTIVLYAPKDSLLIEDYFYYKEDGTVTLTKNNKALVGGRWFSMEDIEKMARKGEIAFDNYKTLKLFEKQVLREGGQ